MPPGRLRQLCPRGTRFNLDNKACSQDSPGVVIVSHRAWFLFRSLAVKEGNEPITIRRIVMECPIGRSAKGFNMTNFDLFVLSINPMAGRVGDKNGRLMHPTVILIFRSGYSN